MLRRHLPAPFRPSQWIRWRQDYYKPPRVWRGRGVHLNYRDHDDRALASVQLFPSLETTLRYADVHTRQYSSVEAFYGNQSSKDKAFDPNCVCGKRVTRCHKWRWCAGYQRYGLFNAEYLLAAKRGPIRFYARPGLGYLGTSGNMKNPLCSHSDKSCYRDNSYKQARSIDGRRCSRSSLTVCA
ncbi:YjbH domain-containing protein [Shigella flexneri]